MSESVITAVIGTAGTVVGAIAGAVAAVIVARANARPKADPLPPEKPEALPVLGKAVDIRELRILRALFGEPRGRYLEAYQDQYYGPALKGMMNKGWVKKIDKRYIMTPEGAKFCHAYLKQTSETWQPADQLLA